MDNGGGVNDGGGGGIDGGGGGRGDGGVIWVMVVAIMMEVGVNMMVVVVAMVGLYG